MRVRWMALALLAVMPAAWAADVDPGSIRGLLKTLEGAASTDAATVYQDDRGFVKFLGAPAGGAFRVETSQKSAGAAAGAKAFVTTHKAAFGLGASSSLSEKKSASHAGATFVRFTQSVGGVPVYGAESVVQLNGDGNVVNVMSDVARDTSAFDQGAVSLTPAVSAEDAGLAARKYVDSLYDKVGLPQLNVTREPKLFVFEPSVLGLGGGARLVWQVEVMAIAGEQVKQEVLVDASSGETIFHYSLLRTLRNRSVYDAQNRPFLSFDLPVREESDPPVGQEEVDNVFDYLGDTYDFYFDEHGRDSWDGEGGEILGFARYPFFNASWNGFFILMGTGLDVDDVVAHEYTHGVTQETSDLIYFGFSGAINESFSDMWGEWVDLVNGAGNDSPEVRWFVGEDIDIDAGGEQPDDGNKQTDDDIELPPGAFRYMKDPTVYGDPDRLLSENLVSPTSFFDNGGVHINSGIGNKLCYLLTDGDTFNGETIAPLGIERTADMFYATQFLLTPAADYFDLYLAMGAASAALGYSFEERLNIAAAGRAVEIAPTLFFSDASLSGLRAVPTRRRTGEPVVSLTWNNPPADILSSVTLVRNVSRFPTSPTDGLVLSTARVEQFLDDVELQEGVTYYYALFAEVTTGFPEIAYAKATPGTAYVAPVIEPFGEGASATGTFSAIDLANAQLTFTPAGPPAGPVGSGQAGVSYEGYEARFTPDVFAFPVTSEGAQNVPMTDDQVVLYSGGTWAFPFFGQWYTQLALSSNGYLTFGPVEDEFGVSPTLAEALEMPRVAFLYADLNPAAAGTIWSKDLDDRFVITFENVPQYDPSIQLPQGNSVQIELFDSGTIRITYGSLNSDPNFPLSAVCGLSDGNGPALDPRTVFPDENLQSVNPRVDLSALPSAPSRLTLAPTGSQTAPAGERFQFTASAVAPAGAAGTPVLFAEWNGPGAVPFGDNGDGTGTFDWQSSTSDAGIYTVRVRAALGGQQAYQDVRIVVEGVVAEPSAINLGISTGLAAEDPRVSRFVPDDRPLAAQYTYVNPVPGDADFNEGVSYLLWVRNGQTVPSLLNSRQVPAAQTVPGDQWYFRLIPVSQNFVAGSPVTSPVVTVEGYPGITSVTPNFGTIYGGDKVRITGSRMRGVLEVTFGGVKAAGLRAISDTEIEVVTPVHLPGTVPVVVKTTSGTGSLLNAFTFLGEGGDFPRADVNSDGRVNATDVQLVINAVLEVSGVKGAFNADANEDGAVNAGDVQAVVNSALYRQ